MKYCTDDAPSDAETAPANNSFLEDLDLVSDGLNSGFAVRHIERHVTTRNSRSPTVVAISEETEFGHLLEQQNVTTAVTPTSSNAKPVSINKVTCRDIKKSSKETNKEVEVKQHTIKIPENKVKRHTENKRKAVENKVQVQDSKSNNQDVKNKVTEAKLKLKDRGRYSDSSKEQSHGSSDNSSKENNKPDVSKERSLHSDTVKNRSRLSDNHAKKLEPKEIPEPIGLLNAIKELISTYTKQESTKILRAMQELHINTQANLIKNLLFQTDEIIREMHPSSESIRFKELVEENEKLREDITILQIKVEELQTKVYESEAVKQENVALKIKYKELLEQKIG
ncbi:uncharacterized protein LOC107274988 isoform X2 [Cephus cinctus]|uniref:Uncharacterized protein LOC107274988 isoform X2 n=1 Tax=Cephus cinctus TaxID=211228 RepID=A0AAJ7R7K2_CEPCN|nr:uncharacterized protein LOC107274988 isoform X2 [Cephus cinctus]